MAGAYLGLKAPQAASQSSDPATAPAPGGTAADSSPAGTSPGGGSPAGISAAGPDLAAGAAPIADAPIVNAPAASTTSTPPPMPGLGNAAPAGSPPMAAPSSAMVSQAVRGVVREDSQNARAAIVVATLRDVAGLTQAQPLATASNLPVEVAARNPAQAKSLAATAETQDYLAGNPVLQNLLTFNPIFAPLLAADARHLGTVETGIRIAGHDVGEIVEGVRAADANFLKGSGDAFITGPLRGLGELTNNLSHPNHAEAFQRITQGDPSYTWRRVSLAGKPAFEIIDRKLGGRLGPPRQYVVPGDDLYEFISNPAARPAMLRQHMALADPGKNWLYQQGEAFHAGMQRVLPTTAAEDANPVTGLIPSTAGKIVGMAGTLALNPTAGMLAGAALGTLNSADDTFRDAYAHGANPIEATNAAKRGAALGLLTSFVPMAGRLESFIGGRLAPLEKYVGTAAKNLLAKAATNATTGLVQGTAQQLGSNAIAQSSYDQSRGWLDNLGEAFTQSALGNILLGFIPNHGAATPEATAPEATAPEASARHAPEQDVPAEAAPAPEPATQTAAAKGELAQKTAVVPDAGAGAAVSASTAPKAGGNALARSTATNPTATNSTAINPRTASPAAEGSAAESPAAAASGKTEPGKAISAAAPEAKAATASRPDAAGSATESDVMAAAPTTDRPAPTAAKPAPDASSQAVRPRATAEHPATTAAASDKAAPAASGTRPDRVEAAAPAPDRRATTTSGPNDGTARPPVEAGTAGTTTKTPAADAAGHADMAGEEPGTAEQSGTAQSGAEQSGATRPGPADLAAILRAAKSAQSLRTILSGASGSRMRRGNNDLFTASLAQMAAHHDAPALRIDPKVLQTYLTRIDPTGPDLMHSVPSIATQLPQAIASGQPVSIPVPEFVQAFADSPTASQLAVHVKPTADAPSLAELAQQVARGGMAAPGGSDGDVAGRSAKVATLATDAAPQRLPGLLGEAPTVGGGGSTAAGPGVALDNTMKVGDLAGAFVPGNDIKVGSAEGKYYPKIAEPIGILRRLLDGINPHYVANAGPGVNTNCESCAVAFYKRFMGIDQNAVAVKTDKRTGGDELRKIIQGPDRGRSLDEIEEDLLANGAYPKVGFILIDQGDYDYHAINYVKLKHSVIYVDPQLGKVVKLKRDLTVELGLPRP